MTLNWSLYTDIVSLVICEQVYSQLKHLLKIKKLTFTMVNVMFKRYLNLNRVLACYRFML